MAETEGDPAVDLPENPRGLLWNIFHSWAERETQQRDSFACSTTAESEFSLSEPMTAFTDGSFTTFDSGSLTTWLEITA
ncbi:hypothetical protein E1301_Tti006376 [Triplophysa tibetana]|uniref:Uncharacterized protein n=1 Tax=Triplophysa tibetana TaxID=1572043 RepID=A0A5A9NX04_9TELE|nr:hypothetical protein E1301_Tti006376 [Triplophysa tibetana]